ncbi:hypothetical protein SIN8267_00047 [Sinobacterium norvegicum]|uniref:DUF416 family protein n=1 Tax=Sinobacterium norvegicum TaxID=1641715 RepID=A0ABN8EEM0_9GAMM|nr:YjaG family protein [Sinobacterium norvegicum]CAH0989970.1 hypothetical protein SIN8267_00047 [Sinobacterium norvegicum]
MAKTNSRVPQQRVTAELRRTVLLAAAVSQRMMPNYQLFCQVTEFTDPTQYRNTLNLVWEWLLVSDAKINFELQSEKLELITPDAADFDMFGVYPAIDACVALASAVNAIVEFESDSYRKDVVDLSRRSIEGFLEMQGVENTAEAELTLHNEQLLDEVMLIADDKLKNKELLKELKRLATNEGVSNLGIAVD